MSIEDQSVIFVKNHMNESFGHVMSSQMIKEMYWIDVEDGARAVAIMGEITEGKKIESNLICLFPIFESKEN
jgi:hypothetical protein